MYRIATFVLIGLTATGCHLVLDIDDTTPVADTTITVRSEGVISPVMVRLTSDEVDETMLIEADGEQTFTHPASPTYAVTLADSAPCALGALAAGGVDGTPVVVDLACIGATRLTQLEVETLTGVQPVLENSITTYEIEVSELQQITRITASPRSAQTTLMTNGVAVPPGMTSAPISLAPGGQTISVVVDHPLSEVLRTTYAIGVARTLTVTHVDVGKAFAEPLDVLGWSVATDGERYVGGAPNEDSRSDPSNLLDDGEPDAGAAFVFVRSGVTWSREAFVKAPNAGAGDRFGWSVAIDGDRLVVGAPFEDSGSTNLADDSLADAGAAYVYRREPLGWVFEQYLKAPRPEGSAYYGYAVAIDGDTLAVGAYREDQYDGATLQGVNAGQVHVYRRAGTSWMLERSLGSDPLTAPGDALGFSLALRGDRLVAGAIAGHPTGNGAGMARVFARTGSTWALEMQVVASDATPNDYFGAAVGIDGDTVVVTALQPVTPAGDQVSLLPGAAYVFEKVGSAWLERQRLQAPNADPDDEFGRSVAIGGGVIAVSAFREDGPGTGIISPSPLNTAGGAGAVYLFERGSAGTWTSTRYIKGPHNETDDQFGVSLAMSRNGVLVIGASGEDSADESNLSDNSVSGAGACFVLH